METLYQMPTGDLRAGRVLVNDFAACTRKGYRVEFQRDKSINRSRNVLLTSCAAHLIQDGLGALQYVVLPLLAQAFGLSYTQIGLLRALTTFAMSTLEVPAGLLAERVGERSLLVVGLLGAASGFLLVAASAQFFWIAAGFTLAGAGAAFQHSLCSALLVNQFKGPDRRRALGTYNAAGDAGKLFYTAVFTVLTGAGLAWNFAIVALALPALALAMIIFNQRRALAQTAVEDRRADVATAVRGWGIRHRGRFSLLTFLIYLDSTVQAVFLTFLAFVLIDRGSTETLAALGVTIALTGGMTGKFVCGYLAARFGDRLVFVLMQVGTAAGLAALMVLPVAMLLWFLPAIGLVVQGSSTMTYGAVADHLHADRQSRGYSLVYALSGLSAVTGPFAFGAIADANGLSLAVTALIGLTVLTLPLCFVLRSTLTDNTELARGV